MHTTCPHCHTSGYSDYIERRDCCTQALESLQDMVELLERELRYAKDTISDFQG